MTRSPNELTASEAVALMRSGDLSVAEMAEACLARAAARDRDVGAWVSLDPERVRAEAARLDGLSERGPLYGVPIGVKDMIHTRDMPTGHNSPIYEGDFPQLDASPVMTLRAAGALIFGKTVTTEFAATTRGGKTKNAHDPARTPGGSSSGSAAAVADMQVPIALGTQTGGSTVRPASFNGVFALKPTWNVINREGLKIYSLTCDTLGLMARSIADLELLADVFHIDDEAPASFGLEGAKIAVCRSPMWHKAEPATRDALALGAALLADAGATVTELTLPPLFDDLYEQHGIVLKHEGRTAFLGEAMMYPDLLHDEFKALVENRAGHDRNTIRAAYDAGAKSRMVFDELAAEYDAVLTPSVTGEAPLGQEHSGDPSFNSIWTFMHAPVVNVPGFRGPAGMPVSLSLTGPRYTDRKMLKVAAAVADLFAARGTWAAAASKAA